jgi:hypothetical protein
MKLDTSGSGAKDCDTNTDVISFCRFSYVTPAGAARCYGCGTGYGLTSDASRCVRHKDVNCRQTIDIVGDICGSCWNGFYWDQETCVLGARIITMVPLGALIGAIGLIGIVV